MTHAGWKKRTPRFAISLICAVGLAAVSASGAVAATISYPSGGSGFNGNDEGWGVSSASCNVPAFCTASGTYDSGTGNPAGSLAANTNIALNLLTLFHSSVTFVSPDFAVNEGGAASVHVDRSFSQGSLVDLSPTLAYTVSLIDRSSGQQSQPITESVPGSDGFLSVDEAASVVPGHTYALAITADTSSSVAGLGLLAGTTSAHFDNIFLRVQGDGSGAGGGKGKNGQNGADGRGTLRSEQLLAQFVAAQPPTATVTKGGKRLLVRVACPKRIGRACRVVAQGMLNRRKAATAPRRAKVGKGKTRLVALRVKPRFRAKVAKRKKLLVRSKVRAGGTSVTVFKTRKLVRR